MTGHGFPCRIERSRHDWFPVVTSLLRGALVTTLPAPINIETIHVCSRSGQVPPNLKKTLEILILLAL